MGEANGKKERESPVVKRVANDVIITLMEDVIGESSLEAFLNMYELYTDYSQTNRMNMQPLYKSMHA